MEDNFFKYYTELPTWAKGAVAIVGLGAFGFVGYKVYKIVFPSLSEKKAKEFLNSIAVDKQHWINKGIKASYTQPQYLTFATTAYEGMKVCVGDNYSAVEDVMKKMQNNLDVALLIEAFGVRQNYCFGLPQGEPIDLITFVKKELGNDYLGLTEYRLNNIKESWQKKGITYKL